jgi:hypothetical protein
VTGGASSHCSLAGHEVSGRAAEDQRSCEFCGEPLIGRGTLARFCSAPCRKRAHEARATRQREADADAERRAERADARRQLARLAGRAERLVLGARDDSRVRCELATVRSMIRAAEARLEQDTAA